MEEAKKFTNMTEEQTRKVMASLYRCKYAEIYEKVINKKWTSEMFVLFCEELHQEMFLNGMEDE
jgi:hypothetical protein